MNEITFEFACRDDCLDKMVPSDLRQLVAERDSLRARLAENEALQAECEKLRKDAERYRWLREHGRYSGKVLVDHADMGRVLRIEKQLDEIIDAEMQRPNR